MKRSVRHIISVFFLLVFLWSGMAGLLPFLSLHHSKQEVAELMSTTESENTGKEKEERIPEKDCIQHGIYTPLPDLIAIDVSRNLSRQPDHWQHVYLAIFSPPPDQL